MNNYQHILEYLFSQLPMYQRIGGAAYKANLNNTLAVCKLLDNPEKDFKSIHIAGTNGKGSVSHFIASILQESGLKVGLYTSPHLKDFRERIKINGEMISEDYVVDFVEKNRDDFEKIKPSFFEMTVGMAFKYFSDEKVDIVVLETGLGGRLDSTNVVNPLLSVITNIGYDHMQFLGETLPEIAAEKAGIIKQGVPVVVGESQEEIRGVFVKRASEMSSEIYFADEIFRCERQKAEGSGGQFTVGSLQLADDQSAISNQQLAEADKVEIGEENHREPTEKEPRRGEMSVVNVPPNEIKEPHRGVTFRCPLLGDYQIKNLQTVFCALAVLNGIGYNIENPVVSRGFENVVTNTGIRGRWEILSKDPLTICDIGHNKDGIAAIVDQLKIIPYQKLHFVFGVVDDKSLPGILDLLPGDATYYFCKANIPRGMDAGELAAAAAVAGLNGQVYPSVADAFETARKNARNDDLVFVGGSTFVVAEVV